MGILFSLSPFIESHLNEAGFGGNVYEDVLSQHHNYKSWDSSFKSKIIIRFIWLLYIEGQSPYKFRFELFNRHFNRYLLLQ